MTAPVARSTGPCPCCGQPVWVPVVCQCGHLALAHDISRQGARTRCLHADGPDGRQCPCTRMHEKENET